MSAIASLVPASLRRWFVDSIYGSQSNRGMWLYVAGLAIFWLLLATWSAGKLGTWPLKADAKVAAFEGDTCEAMAFGQYREPLAADADSVGNAAAETADRDGDRGDANCTDPSEGQRLQLDQARELASNLREGTPRQTAEFDAPEGSALRAWVDSHVCRLSGAGSREDRAALGWYVRQGVGKCSSGARLVAGFPLVVWFGYWVGLILTPLFAAVAAVLLLAHAAKIPSTRAAYRRLYGSEHRAP